MMSSETMTVTGNTPLTRPENRAFYPALDGFRCLAFLMVFFQHYAELPWGWVGVDFFFVLSGFLITGILFDSRDDPFRVRNFYVRRTLRIFPLYYGVMLFLLLLAPLCHWKWSWAWLLWPAYLGNFLHDIYPLHFAIPYAQVANFQLVGTVHGRWWTLYMGHFWSLCVEEQFYLVWPWLVFWVRDRRKLLSLCAATLPLCLVTRLLCNQYLPPALLRDGFLYTFTPVRLDALLMGGLLALWLRGPQAHQLLRAARVALPIMIGALVLGIAFSPLRHVHATPYPYPAGMYSWALSVVDVLGALLILVVIQPDTYLYRFFNMPPLRWAGRLTYGAYVLHDIPHDVYRAMADHITDQHTDQVTTAIALVGTFGLAWLSFRLVERPFLNLKERLTIRTNA
jgi:peptidoglycan/LPS O-acetylase OafA/YrhL